MGSNPTSSADLKIIPSVARLEFFNHVGRQAQRSRRFNCLAQISVAAAGESHLLIYNSNRGRTPSTSFPSILHSTYMDTQPIDKELHRIAITCIIYNNAGKYLVTKRSPHKKVHPGKWTVPGGGLTTDDYIHTPQTGGDAGWYGAAVNALRREVREETGLEIGTPEYLLDLTFIRPDGIPVLVLSYYAPYVSGDVKLDDDAVEYRWVTLIEAKELDLIPGIYDELELVEQRR